MKCYHERECEVRDRSKKACQGRFCRDTCPHGWEIVDETESEMPGGLQGDTQRGAEACDES